MPYSFAFFTRQKYQEVRSRSFFTSDSTKILDGLFAPEGSLTVEEELAAFQFWICFHILYNQESKRFAGIEALLGLYTFNAQHLEHADPEALFLSYGDRRALLKSLRHDWVSLCQKEQYLDVNHPAARLLSRLLDVVHEQADTPQVKFQYTLAGVQSAAEVLALSFRALSTQPTYQRIMSHITLLLVQEKTPSTAHFAKEFREEMEALSTKRSGKGDKNHVFILQFLLDCLAELMRALFAEPKITRAACLAIA